MVCAICGGKTIVKSTVKFSDEIARQRVCIKCGYVFYTSEAEISEELGKNLINARYKQYAFERRTEI